MNQTIENIKAIRKKLKISQAEIADGYGVDRSTYSKIEKNQSNLRLEADLLIYVSTVFKMSIDEVVHYHVNEYKDIENTSIINEDSQPYLILNERNAFLKSQNEELKEQLKSLQFIATSSAEYNKRLMQDLDEVKQENKLLHAKIASMEVKN